MSKKQKSIYLIECGKQYYKIGIASNMASRLSGLNGSNPFPLHIVTRNKIDNAHELERNFHKKLKHRRVSGEWFELTPSEVLEVCIIIHSEKKRRKFLCKKTKLLDDNEAKIYNRERKEWIKERDGLFSPKREKQYLEKTNMTKSRVDGDISLAAEAVAIIKTYNRASTSLLQLKLKIGYVRAARIMDILEKKKIVGPYNGYECRKILLSKKNE